MSTLLVRNSGGSVDMASDIEAMFNKLESDCIEFVMSNPGCTAGEFNAYLDCDMSNVITASRPMDTLKRRGILRNGPMRYCTVKTNRRMLTWYFVTLNVGKRVKPISKYERGYADGWEAALLSLSPSNPPYEESMRV